MIGTAGALGGVAAGIQAWNESHDWWKAAMAAGFSVYSLLQVTRRDALHKLENATVTSNIETATRVEEAIAKAGPGQILGDLARRIPTAGETWQPFGGGDTMDLGGGMGDDLLLGGGGEVTRRLSWGDLPAGDEGV